ncbi:hypothetical protein [Noviherbaspirillum sp.]|uniref:hypothetical protein n=1 Tax=Noviherbaspirillum sp. TaxID=1926288 RepID=UPI002FE02F44
MAEKVSERSGLVRHIARTTLRLVAEMAATSSAPTTPKIPARVPRIPKRSALVGVITTPVRD